MPRAGREADGSVELDFGAQPRAGREANFIDARRAACGSSPSRSRPCPTTGSSPMSMSSASARSPGAPTTLRGAPRRICCVKPSLVGPGGVRERWHGSCSWRDQEDSSTNMKLPPWHDRDAARRRRCPRRTRSRSCRRTSTQLSADPDTAQCPQEQPQPSTTTHDDHHQHRRRRRPQSRSAPEPTFQAAPPPARGATTESRAVWRSASAVASMTSRSRMRAG